MNKIIRKAVRTYLIEDNKIVVINYKSHDSGYYDIPGGKIEDNETAEETSIREFKEETGMDIIKQHFIGKILVEYPNRIFDFKIFIVDEYKGIPLEFDENKSIWIDLNDLESKAKIFPSIEAIKYLKNNMNLKITCESNNKVIEVKEL